MQLISNSPKESFQIVAELMQKYPKHKIWLLEGDLSAGKTEIVKGMAKFLKIKDQVSSPTFAYLNNYDSKLKHYDLYRLEGQDEDLMRLIEEDFESDAYIAIEWASRLNLNPPKAYLEVKIKHLGGDTRELIIGNLLQKGTQT